MKNKIEIRNVKKGSKTRIREVKEKREYLRRKASKGQSKRRKGRGEGEKNEGTGKGGMRGRERHTKDVTNFLMSIYYFPITSPSSYW